MKRFILIFSLNLCLSIQAQKIDWLNLPELDPGWENYTEQQIQEFNLVKASKERSDQLAYLRLAKAYLLKGQLELSQYYLTKMDSAKSPLEAIKGYYQSLIHFMYERYDLSLEILDGRNYQSSKNYPRICMLKVLNLMAMHKLERLYGENTRCLNATEDFSQNDQLWTKTIVSFFYQRFVTPYEVRGRNFFQNAETVRIWLKSILYSNQQKRFLSQINELPPWALKSHQVRELLGLLYYRLGETKLATEFMEGLESANARNLRGVEEMNKSRFEIALGHFQLALKDKANSINALERAIPLAWLLSKHEDGLEMVQRLVEGHINERKQQMIKMAFLIKLKKWDEAESIYRYLVNKYGQNIPPELILMQSFLSLNRGDAKGFKQLSDKACRQFDGALCYLHQQTLLWENLGKTSARVDEFPDLSEFSPDVLRKDSTITPLQEPAYIDQNDIEEMDGQQSLKYWKL